MQMATSDAERDVVLPDHLMLYQDDLTKSMDAETFQERLWGMFPYAFGKTLTVPQIDRIRWHLFPEIRIDAPLQMDAFEHADIRDQTFPDIIRIMDIQQEQLARSMGEGHRVIHGVAGSGKTMILGYRCLQLAQQAAGKPILVLCFNVALGSQLRAFIAARGMAGQVEVDSFHAWCKRQLETYHVQLLQSDKEVWERLVETLINAVDKGQIPLAQYSAVLIDEGQDFEKDWLKLVVQMVDPETNNLLLLYDDVQSIYRNTAGLGFSMIAAGIQAQGRTTILRLNYRNTREILDFAYRFVRHYLNPMDSTDEIAFIRPESAGLSGPVPVVCQFDSMAKEFAAAVNQLQVWHREGVPWKDMAILYPRRYMGKNLFHQLESESVPTAWLAKNEKNEDRGNYDPDQNKIVLATLSGCKGLEFHRVVIVGLGEVKEARTQGGSEARQLYVGMTRARKHLLVFSSGKNEFTSRLMGMANTA